MNKMLPLGSFKRFGVLGGSFDPIHLAHLSIAQQVMNGLNMEQVVLLPAATPPHKQDGRAMADAQDRLEMCRLAIHDMRGLAVSDFEIVRGGVSYTVETARQLRAAYGPDAEIYFVIGSDSLAELPQWFQIKELLTLIRFGIAERREVPLKESRWQELREKLGKDAEEQLRSGVVSVQRVDVSSTLIRKLLHEGDKVSGYLRRDVEAYIRRKGLYGAQPKATQGPRIIL